MTGGELPPNFGYQDLATTVAFNGSGWAQNAIPNLPMGLASI